MNISSTPFIRNDYWPDYNDIDILNKRIDEAENETSLVNSRLTNDIENVSNNLNSYKNEMADTVITNNIIVNNLNANYAVGKYANFINTNTDNAYIENLTVNKPVFDITLNTPHVENITSIGGNFYDANMFNVAIDNLLINTQSEPITSSAVLGYDSKGRVIPIHAAFEVGFPENANYLYTDQHGTAFPGTAETEVNASDNLITSYAVYNALANVNNSFNNVNIFVNNGFNNVNNGFNNVNIFVNNGFNNVNNSFNNVNNTINSLQDEIQILLNGVFIELSVDLGHEYRLTINPETYDSSWSVTNGGTLQNGFFIYKDGNSIEYLSYIKFNASSQIAEGDAYGRTTKIYRIASPDIITQLFGNVSGNKQILPEGTLVATDDGKVYRKLEWSLY